MKQTIQLRLGQHLTMTPQLQQAIRLLQLSTLELQMEVQTVLDSNLMLEREEEAAPEPSEQQTSAEPQEQAPAEPKTTEASGSTDSIPDELPVDTNWEDTYDMGVTTYSAPASNDNRDFLETQSGGAESLYEHLRWQLDLTTFSDIDQAIAETILDAIDDNGYLQISVEEIQETMDLPAELEVGKEEICAVLKRIQHFDPVGVGARDPAECLQIQLEQLDPDTTWLAEARLLVKEHVNLLGNRDYNQIMRRMKLSEQELQEVLGLVQTLNPRPGSQITNNTPQYVVPDVF
ncbi:MAG: RNA polymerase factor sigma-54, partial [Gammaproteobacteria bacterium]